MLALEKKEILENIFTGAVQNNYHFEKTYSVSFELFKNKGIIASTKVLNI
jgi:hypothetical protein